MIDNVDEYYSDGKERKMGRNSKLTVDGVVVREADPTTNTKIWTVDLGSFQVEADSLDLAYATALKRIKEGDVEIDQIFEFA